MLLSPQLKRNKPWLLIWSGHVKAQFLNIFEEGTAQWTLRRAGPWQGRARRWTPGWARRRPLPARRHGDANRAPGFKDKAVISDAQQPGGAGRAPCHLTSHYTNALHAAPPARPGPAQGHTTRAYYTDTLSGLRRHSKHRNNQSRFHSLILREKSGGTCEIISSGEKTLSGKEKAHLSFTTV